MTALLLGHEPSDQGIGVAMTQLMLRLEVADKLHVLEWASLLKDLHPVGDRLAVLFLDGWKVGSRAFD